MKILHINSYYSGSMFYKNLFDKQIESGLDIDVFVPVSSSYKKNGIDFGSYTMISANHNKYDRLIFHLKHKKIYKDVVQKYDINQYSVIHAHSLFSNGYIAMKLKQQYGVPYIVAVRNTDVNIFFKRLIHLRGIGVQILKEAKNIIFLSKAYRAGVLEKYVPNKLKGEVYEKSSIIPNGIDDFWFKNIGTKENIPYKDNLKLLYVGIIDKNKNITTTIKAIEKLQEKGYNIKFTVVGKIKDNKVYNEIKDKGFVNYILPSPKEKLLEIYRANDIFVMPSITETFGLVYAEAMSQGLPVIYSKGQGFDKQFEGGEVGCSVDALDDSDVAVKIEEVFKTYKEKSERCSELCRKFNWKKISKFYSEVYK